MTVSELIDLLKTCDPKARVVVNEEPIVEDDRDVMAGTMQDVEALESGWVDDMIESDLTFSLRPIGAYLVPAVRIMGCNHEATDPEQKIIYNGLEPMRDVEVVPIKRIPRS